MIAGLRARGAKHLAIISGDNEQPTRKLAEKLGMDRYFAEVLPQDKARYVELLQKEGRTVCFIGDGVSDSIALKKANVSISLRGASGAATDTAQVVFMDGYSTRTPRGRRRAGPLSMCASPAGAERQDGGISMPSKGTRSRSVRADLMNAL